MMPVLIVIAVGLLKVKQNLYERLGKKEIILPHQSLGQIYFMFFLLKYYQKFLQEKATNLTGSGNYLVDVFGHVHDKLSRWCVY